MKDNPTISRIRSARKKISARFGHDIEKLGRYYIERQKRHKHKLIKASMPRMKYLECRNGQRSFKDIAVMGKVTWDDNYEGQIPMLIIDGQKISWFEFGRMVMSFEGWKFKLEMIDDSKPLNGNKPYGIK